MVNNAAASRARVIVAVVYCYLFYVYICVPLVVSHMVSFVVHFLN